MSRGRNPRPQTLFFLSPSAPWGSCPLGNKVLPWTPTAPVRPVRMSRVAVFQGRFMDSLWETASTQNGIRVKMQREKHQALKCSLCVCAGTCHRVVTTSLAPRWLTIKASTPSPVLWAHVLSAQGLAWEVPVRSAHPVREVGSRGCWDAGTEREGTAQAQAGPSRTLADEDSWGHYPTPPAFSPPWGRARWSRTVRGRPAPGTETVRTTTTLLFLLINGSPLRKRREHAEFRGDNGGDVPSL